MTVQLSSLKPACMRYCPWELAVNRWKTLLILVLLSFPSRLGPPTWTLPARTSSWMQDNFKVKPSWHVGQVWISCREFLQKGVRRNQTNGRYTTTIFSTPVWEYSAAQALTSSAHWVKKAETWSTHTNYVTCSSGLFHWLPEIKTIYLLILLGSGISILLTFNWLIQQSFDNWVGDYIQIG